MTDRDRSPNDLVLPFIFIPHGAPESPEVAAFKARYPGWITIPATFVPRVAGAPDQRREEARSSEPYPGEFTPSRVQPLSPVHAFERSYATMNDPGAVPGITRVAADTPPASGSGHAYVAADPEQWIGRLSVGTGQCVPLVQQATGAPLTSQWHRGALVKGNMNIRPGTAIATFDDDGHYGNHTDGRSHAAIYLGQDAYGIWVIDQWNERRPGQPARRIAPHARRISFDDRKKSIDNGNKYYVVE
ncbi:MAG TPA: BPSL0067 family protein [Acetobacteraceae bacterium]|nr:BPSL0067 family protein [Acetobacteraceae bacterium]